MKLNINFNICIKAHCTYNQDYSSILVYCHLKKGDSCINDASYLIKLVTAS